MSHLAETAGAAARRAGPLGFFGAVKTITGVAVLVEDRLGALEVGARVEIETDGGSLAAEVVGVTDGEAVCLPFGGVAGVRRGARVSFASPHGRVAPSSAWLGRVVDALGRPVDGKGPLAPGPVARDLRATPPPAATRGRLGKTVAFGVKALDVFCPARSGQRLGVFFRLRHRKIGPAGDDCAQYRMRCRGDRADWRTRPRTVSGPRARQIGHCVATSDEPAMMRREAAYLAMSVSEAFREQRRA
ncbi:MAG: hypothetical protein R3C40_09285 [Parvularculaceae bacterium]